MKRLYQEYANGSKELKGYDYEGVIIEIDWSECNSYYNPWKRDGYLVPQLKELGKTYWFETLKQAKESINQYLK